MIVPSLVSVILPVYNRPRMLEEAVASVMTQSYRPLEVLIIDDASTDGETPAVAASLARTHAPFVRVLWQENGGPGKARETGRLEAAGEFVQYLDSDDLLLPDKFCKQVEGLRWNPHCGVSYGPTRFRRGDGHLDPRPLKRTAERIETIFPSFLEMRWWDTSTPLWRREVTDAIGPWLPLRLEEDWEYDCRAGAQGVKLHFCDATVSETRTHAETRLSGGPPLDRARLRDRSVAHLAVWSHAQKAQIAVNTPERCHFSRALFLLARYCGAAGLCEQSRHLFEASREAAGPTRSRGWDFALYASACRAFGWRIPGLLSVAADSFRGRPRSGRTAATG